MDDGHSLSSIVHRLYERTVLSCADVCTCGKCLYA